MKIQKIDEAELFDEDVLINMPHDPDMPEPDVPLGPDTPLELEEKHKLDYGS